MQPTCPFGPVVILVFNPFTVHSKQLQFFIVALTLVSPFGTASRHWPLLCPLVCFPLNCETILITSKMQHYQFQTPTCNQVSSRSWHCFCSKTWLQYKGPHRDLLIDHMRCETNDEFSLPSHHWRIQARRHQRPCGVRMISIRQWSSSDRRWLCYFFLLSWMDVSWD